MNSIKQFLLVTVLCFFHLFTNGQAIGDYISIATGNWSNPSTWGVVTGTGPLTWSAAGATPSVGNNVFVMAGTKVTIVFGTIYFCNDLTVQATGQLYTNNATLSSAQHTYVSVYGNIVCNGQVGNAPIHDNICFDIDGANCTLTGTGLFDVSRIRKISAGTTNFIMSMNVNILYPGSTLTLLYNNCSSAGVFNVTVSAGAILNLNASGPGDVSIDGVNMGGSEAGGTFTINGTIIVGGKMFMSNNNTSSQTNWIINGLMQVAEIVIPATTNAGSTSSLTVNSGGKLQITGTNAFSTLVTTNNIFNFVSGSTQEYSYAGAQTVRVASEFGSTAVNNQYGNLILSNSGGKTATVTDLYVKNDLTISGSAVLSTVISSKIFVGGNWYNYNQSGFTENNTIVYFNNASSIGQSINCPGGEVFYILRQNSTNNLLTFNCPVTVQNSVVFASVNGNIDLNSNSLTIINPLIGGILGGGPSRYIISEKVDNSSKVIWKIGSSTSATAYTIPFGILPNSTANYIPVLIYKPSATNVGDLTVSTYGTGANNQPWPTTPTNVTNLQANNPVYNTPDNRAYCVDRFWQINSTGGGAIDSFKFTYRTTELPTADPVQANMRAQFWDTSISYWYVTQFGVASVVTSPSALNVVSVPNFNVYNTAWTLSSIVSPLPIDLLYFTANKNEEEKNVKLVWSTATEINNQFFEIQKSSDGVNFYPIGKVAGAGNSTQTLNYFYFDNQPLPGISYYRLKQMDYDGQFQFSDVAAINFKNDQQLAVFPNPVSSDINVAMSGPINGEILITDISGRVIKRVDVNSTTKSDLISVSVEGFLPGIYFIELIGDSKMDRIRFIKN